MQEAGVIRLIDDTAIATEDGRFGIDCQNARHAMDGRRDRLGLPLNQNIAEFLVVEPIAGEDLGNLQQHGQQSENQDSSGDQSGEPLATATAHGVVSPTSLSRHSRIR